MIHQQALLIIDLQNDFTLETGKTHTCIEQVDEAIPRINQVSRLFHEKGGQVIYFKTLWSNPLARFLSKNALTEGSEGAELDPRLEQVTSHIFTKGEKSVFSSASFCRYLQIKSIQKLYLTGVTADQSIKLTAMKALEQDFEVTVLQDCVAVSKCHYLDKSLLQLSAIGVELLETTNIEWPTPTP